MDRIDALRLFCSVAELGSFTQAAEREGITPGAASKQITALETRLQARLFERTTRSVRLTDAGTALFDRVEPWLAEYDALEEGVAEISAAPAGVLRVAVPVDFGAKKLIGPVTDFMARWPAVEVRLTLGDRMVDLVNEGFDVGVRIGNLPDSALIAKQLAPATGVAIASRDYLQAAGTPQHPLELGAHDVIIDRNRPAPNLLRLKQDGEAFEVRVKGRLTLNGAVCAVEAAAAGAGIAVVPSWAAEQALAEGRVVEILPDSSAEERFLWAVFPSSRYLTHRVRLFVDHLAEVFKGGI